MSTADGSIDRSITGDRAGQRPCRVNFVDCADNLALLRSLQDGSCNLVYVDPPFKSTSNGPIYFHPDGPALSDVWDIPFLSTVSKERTNYPTQKPEALLERIIRASSNEGDLVADFFCGSGTALVVAKRLNRRWLGCDVNPDAVAIARQRLARIK